MACREILLFPHPSLRTPCEEVKEVDEEVCRLLDDLAETMYAARGVGLAAPQVGVHRRVVVIDVESDRGDGLIELINPRILTSSENKATSEEGCFVLSRFVWCGDAVRRSDRGGIESSRRELYCRRKGAFVRCIATRDRSFGWGAFFGFSESFEAGYDQTQDAKAHTRREPFSSSWVGGMYVFRCLWMWVVLGMVCVLFGRMLRGKGLISSEIFLCGLLPIPWGSRHWGWATRESLLLRERRVCISTPRDWGGGSIPISLKVPLPFIRRRIVGFGTLELPTAKATNSSPQGFLIPTPLIP